MPPLFGAHFSVAGGLVNAVRTAVELGAETLQLFTKNANQWAGKPLKDEEITLFRKELAESRVQFPTAHDSYLINLAAPDDALYQKSIAAFEEEMNRAERLGLSYLVMHPGAHVGSGEEAGLQRVVEAFDILHKRTRGFQLQVLVETTAGQGTTLGWKFEHLHKILNTVKEPERLGVCLDTCHVFAAGYGLDPNNPLDGYDVTWELFDSLVGIQKLRALHVNDSVKPQGSRVDRHAGIGLGQIGEAPFRRLVNDPRLQGLPFLLETPKEDDDGNPMDPINLEKLRGFVEKPKKKAVKKKLNTP